MRQEAFIRPGRHAVMSAEANRRKCDVAQYIDRAGILDSPARFPPSMTYIIDAIENALTIINKSNEDVSFCVRKHQNNAKLFMMTEA